MIPSRKQMQHILKRKRLCRQFEEQAIMYGIDVLDTTFIKSKKDIKESTSSLVQLREQ